MLTLRAYVPGDGWAFAERDGHIYLVKPPFEHRGSPVSRAQLDAAVSHHGFSPSALAFSDFAELIQFLEDEVRRSLAAAHAPEPSEIRSKILAASSLDQIRSYLSQIDTRLIEQGHFDRAQEILISLLEPAASNRSLVQEIGQHLDEITHARRRRHDDRDGLVAIDVQERFPCAADKYGDRMRNFVRGAEERGSVLAFCS